MLERVTIYLSFLEYARGIGRGFHNFLGYDRHWLDAEGCGDSQGQTVRALAEVLGSGLPDGYRAVARELIDAVLPTLADLRSLASPVLCDHGLGAPVGFRGGRHRTAGNGGLVGGRATGRMLPPCRAARLAMVRVAHDLCQRGAAARAVHRRQALARGELPRHRASSFAFLDQHTTAATESIGCPVFWPIGNEGWYPRGEEKALYDQQPVEAVTMGEAAQAAFDLLGDEQYLATFRRAYGWFLAAIA